MALNGLISAEVPLRIYSLTQCSCCNVVSRCVCVYKLELHPEPWQDLVFGPVSLDVASVEGDPVSLMSACVAYVQLWEILHVTECLKMSKLVL